MLQGLILKRLLQLTPILLILTYILFTEVYRLPRLEEQINESYFDALRTTVEHNTELNRLDAIDTLNSINMTEIRVIPYCTDCNVSVSI